MEGERLMGETLAKGGLEIPCRLTRGQKAEYLKIAAKYWKNYFFALKRIVEGRDEADEAQRRNKNEHPNRP